MKASAAATKKLDKAKPSSGNGRKSAKTNDRTKPTTAKKLPQSKTKMVSATTAANALDKTATEVKENSSGEANCAAAGGSDPPLARSPSMPEQRPATTRQQQRLAPLLPLQEKKGTASHIPSAVAPEQPHKRKKKVPSKTRGPRQSRVATRGGASTTAAAKEPRGADHSPGEAIGTAENPTPAGVDAPRGAATTKEELLVLQSKMKRAAAADIAKRLGRAEPSSSHSAEAAAQPKPAEADNHTQSATAEEAPKPLDSKAKQAAATEKLGKAEPLPINGRKAATPQTSIEDGDRPEPTATVEECKLVQSKMKVVAAGKDEPGAVTTAAALGKFHKIRKAVDAEMKTREKRGVAPRSLPTSAPQQQQKKKKKKAPSKTKGEPKRNGAANGGAFATATVEERREVNHSSSKAVGAAEQPTPDGADDPPGATTAKEELRLLQSKMKRAAATNATMRFDRAEPPSGQSTEATAQPKPAEADSHPTSATAEEALKPSHSKTKHAAATKKLGETEPLSVSSRTAATPQKPIEAGARPKPTATKEERKLVQSKMKALAAEKEKPGAVTATAALGKFRQIREAVDAEMKEHAPDAATKNLDKAEPSSGNITDATTPSKPIEANGRPAPTAAEEELRLLQSKVRASRANAEAYGAQRLAQRVQDQANAKTLAAEVAGEQRELIAKHKREREAEEAEREQRAKITAKEVAAAKESRKEERREENQKEERAAEAKKAKKKKRKATKKTQAMTMEAAMQLAREEVEKAKAAETEQNARQQHPDVQEQQKPAVEAQIGRQQSSEKKEDQKRTIGVEKAKAVKKKKMAVTNKKSVEMQGKTNRKSKKMEKPAKSVAGKTNSTLKKTIVSKQQGPQEVGDVSISCASKDSAATHHSLSHGSSTESEGLASIAGADAAALTKRTRKADAAKGVERTHTKEADIVRVDAAATEERKRKTGKAVDEEAATIEEAEQKRESDRIAQEQQRVECRKKDLLVTLVKSILHESRSSNKNVYYTVLGLTPAASLGDIKKAYRKLALKLHPDKDKYNTPNAAEAYHTVVNAYDTLKEATTREAYDCLQNRRSNITINPPPAVPGSTISVGTSVTIRSSYARCPHLARLSGTKGTVLKYQPLTNQYTVKLENGTTVLAGASSLFQNIIVCLRAYMARELGVFLVTLLSFWHDGGSYQVRYCCEQTGKTKMAMLRPHQFIVPNGTAVLLGGADHHCHRGEYGTVIDWKERLDNLGGDASYYEVRMSLGVVRAKMAHVFL